MHAPASRIFAAWLPLNGAAGQRVLALWLAVLLVLAPTLGRMHQVLHLPQLGAAAVVAVSASASADGGAPHAHSGGLQRLFHHPVGLDCLVFDQLAQGHLPTAAMAMPAAPLPAALPVFSSCGVHQPAAPAVFAARAPPAFLPQRS